MQKNKKQTKFESVQELENAYVALEAEFTKRCQQISLLKKTIEELTEKIKNTQPVCANSVSDEVKNEIISQYLVALAGAKRVKTLSQNVGKMTVAPPKQPKTLQEAKILADILISKE